MKIAFMVELDVKIAGTRDDTTQRVESLELWAEDNSADEILLTRLVDAIRNEGSKIIVDINGQKETLTYITGDYETISWLKESEGNDG